MRKDSDEQLELELQLAQLLIDADSPDEAKVHLESALSTHPESPRALRLHADVSAALGAHQSAERSLVQLRERLRPGEERTAVLRSLARLYHQHLQQYEKAMDAYQDLLQLDPNNRALKDSLVEVYCELGLAERATSLQTKIIQSAVTPDEKRDGALRLAELYETVASDPKRAGATLELHPQGMAPRCQCLDR